MLFEEVVECFLKELVNCYEFGLDWDLSVFGEGQESRLIAFFLDEVCDCSLGLLMEVVRSTFWSLLEIFGGYL